MKLIKKIDPFNTTVVSIPTSAVSRSPELDELFGSPVKNTPDDIKIRLGNIEGNIFLVSIVAMLVAVPVG